MIKELLAGRGNRRGGAFGTGPAVLAFWMIALIGSVAAQDRWQPSGLSGKNIGRLKLAVDGSLYAATDNGLYRSADNGASWSATPLKGRMENVATGQENWVYASGASGFSRSGDGGATWSTMAGKDVQAKFGIVKAVAVDHDGRVFIGTNGGVWRSTDHGAAWAELPGEGLPEGFPDINVIEVGAGGELLAASWGIIGGDLYGSVDGGESWIRLYDGDMDIQAVGAAPSGEYLISIYRSKDLFRSTNGGTNWSGVSPGVDISSTPVVGFVFGATSWYAVARGAGVLRSTDHGAHWAMTDAGLPGTATMQNIVATPSGEILAGTSSGVYHLTSASTVSQEVLEIPGKAYLYPNPAFDHITVDYNSSGGTTAEFRVVDMLGREVATVEGGNGERSIRLATDRLPVGQYLYSLRVGDTLQRGVFTVMR